ncbi:MAG: hypothetical protein GY861_11085 [bacterium]|nr:hypothetical protein [bacterium]
MRIKIAIAFFVLSLFHGTVVNACTYNAGKIYTLKTSQYLFPCKRNHANCIRYLGATRISVANAYSARGNNYTIQFGACDRQSIPFTFDYNEHYGKNVISFDGLVLQIIEVKLNKHIKFKIIGIETRKVNW